MTALRPFFSFYGAKYGIARRYPEPTHRTIVEPFAGSAGYSLHYPDRDVVLVDADPHVARTWSYLVGASRAEILDLPDLGPGDDVNDLAVPEGARYLIGFWLGRGKMRPGRRPSAWMLSGRYDGCAYFWGPRARERLAAQVERIRHWRVVEGGYAEAPDVAATWFVDPPYDCPAGRLYRRRPSDYAALADWCRARRGQVIACERDGAGWLPFEPLLERRTIDGRRSREAVYHQAGGELGGDQVASAALRAR